MSSGKSRQPSPKSSIPDFAPEDFVIPDLPESDEEPDRTDYEGRLKKIELDRAEGRLLDKNTQKKNGFDLGRLLRDKLAGLPSKLAARVSAETDVKKNERLIRNECNRCGREILRRMADFGRR
mgnify:FL=1